MPPECPNRQDATPPRGNTRVNGVIAGAASPELDDRHPRRSHRPDHPHDQQPAIIGAAADPPKRSSLGQPSRHRTHVGEVPLGANRPAPAHGGTRASTGPGVSKISASGRRRPSARGVAGPDRRAARGPRGAWLLCRRSGSRRRSRDRGRGSAPILTLIQTGPRARRGPDRLASLLSVPIHAARHTRGIRTAGRGRSLAGRPEIRDLRVRHAVDPTVVVTISPSALLYFRRGYVEPAP
jgi:hypothetical protein